MNAFPLKRVVKTYDYSDPRCRPGEGSRVHTLECGHEIRAKQSFGFPRKKRCRDCFYGLSKPKPK